MNVLIDADGCPVVDTVRTLCKKYHIPCTIYCDTAHEYLRADTSVVTVDKGADHVDFMIVNQAHPGDLVITQDYGLASMCLSKNIRVLHQDGWEYTEQNIDALLFQRHAAKKLRNSGARIKGSKKRTTLQNQMFYSALEQLLQTIVHGKTSGGSF